MTRLHPHRLLLLFFAASLVTACGGARPPRPANRPAPPPVAAPANVVRPASFVPLSAPPPVFAESAIVVDYASGRVLYAKNADVTRQVASTQKIVTALTVLSAGDLDKVVTIEPSDENCEPTKLNVKPGEQYTRRDLLKVLMVKSANDIGRALARDVGGSQEGFAAMMNRTASSLGMARSHFCNPHGLPNAEQFSTARDLAIAARSAYRSPLLRSFCSTRSFVFRYASGRLREVENTNKLLQRLPYCDGMKTGTTDAAGRCLVATGTLNGRSAIVVVLKSTTPQVWNDSEKLLRWALERPAS